MPTNATCDFLSESNQIVFEWEFIYSIINDVNSEKSSNTNSQVFCFFVSYWATLWATVHLQVDWFEFEYELVYSNHIVTYHNEWYKWM